MATSYKVQAAFAAGLSALLLAVAALTLLPGRLPLPPGRWVAGGVALALGPLFIAALIRLLRAGPHPGLLLLAVRCLPVRVLAALAALVLTGVVLAMSTVSAPGSPEVREGRYYVLDLTPGQRGYVEVSLAEYQAARESERRALLAIPAVLLAVSAFVVLLAGELRRSEPEADGGRRPAAGGRPART